MEQGLRSKLKSGLGLLDRIMVPWVLKQPSEWEGVVWMLKRWRFELPVRWENYIRQVSTEKERGIKRISVCSSRIKKRKQKARVIILALNGWISDGRLSFLRRPRPRVRRPLTHHHQNPHHQIHRLRIPHPLRSRPNERDHVPTLPE
jgi:hypothetical protein